MGVFNLFSKRQKALRGEVPDVYRYDQLPATLRVQIIHIWRDTLGWDSDLEEDTVQGTYKNLVEMLCREYGVFRLPPTSVRDSYDYPIELVNFLLNEESIEKALDAVELSFRAIDKISRNPGYLRRRNASEKADSAIAELNARFREHGVGYQYASGEIVRVDSQYVHQEVVIPALRLFNQKHFSGAEQEFLNAHEHYRKGNAKEALNECLKALESVMKAICDKRGWTYPPNAQAKGLIDICLANGLIPVFWQSAFASLRSLLESGVPTGRNKLSGHGQGTSPIPVPSHIVSFMLHMTASAVVFLAEAEASTK